MSAERPRHKLIEGKRISTITRYTHDLSVNPAEREDWEGLRILFTDGTVATIEGKALFGENVALEVEVDGY